MFTFLANIWSAEVNRGVSEAGWTVRQEAAWAPEKQWLGYRVSSGWHVGEEWVIVFFYRADNDNQFDDADDLAAGQAIQ